jgi:hypothetical protein
VQAIQQATQDAEGSRQKLAGRGHCHQRKGPITYHASINARSINVKLTPISYRFIFFIDIDILQLNQFNAANKSSTGIISKSYLSKIASKGDLHKSQSVAFGRFLVFADMYYRFQEYRLASSFPFPFSRANKKQEAQEAKKQAKRSVSRAFNTRHRHTTYRRATPKEQTVRRESTPATF